MTKEDKQILLKDLCDRLPYGVKCQIDYDNEEDADLGIERYCDDRIVSVCTETEEIGLYEASEYFYPDEIKPYLRTLSSMTKEEKKELINLCEIDYIYEDIVDFGEFLGEGSPVNIKNIYGLLDWLNAHHFDYRGLIKKGLALPAPKGMYNF